MRHFERQLPETVTDRSRDAVLSVFMAVATFPLTSITPRNRIGFLWQPVRPNVTKTATTVIKRIIRINYDVRNR